MFSGLLVSIPEIGMQEIIPYCTVYIFANIFLRRPKNVLKFKKKTRLDGVLFLNM
jgi:hypothetical protein